MAVFAYIMGSLMLFFFIGIPTLFLCIGCCHSSSKKNPEDKQLLLAL